MFADYLGQYYENQLTYRQKRLSEQNARIAALELRLTKSLTPPTNTLGVSVDSRYADSIILDPNDPFDAALIPMVLTNRKKRADYATDGDPFSNFRVTSDALGLSGFGAKESALFNVLQKVARLKALRENGRMDDAANEAVIDTYMDLSVYSVILYALALEDNNTRTIQAL